MRFSHRGRVIIVWLAISVVYALTFLVSGGILLLRAPAEQWLGYSIPFMAPVLLLIAFLARVVLSRHVPASVRNPKGVQFSTQNVPGAMVYLEPFVVDGAAFARGPSFLIVADDDGISYFTRRETLRPFVQIPWSEVASVDELAGELCITLMDGNLLLHIPGGMLPVGATRVRAIAASMSALLRERQP